MAVYGVLGDIHGNREALEAALAGIDAIGVDRVICVGDLIGYNADSDACVRILQGRDALCIAGNHDLIGTGRLGLERCSNKAQPWSATKTRSNGTRVRILSNSSSSVSSTIRKRSFAWLAM
jgi:predicted phosphodiesterase